MSEDSANGESTLNPSIVVVPMINLMGLKRTLAPFEKFSKFCLFQGDQKILTGLYNGGT